MPYTYKPVSYTGSFRPVSVDPVVLNGRSLTLNDVVAVSRYKAPVSMAPDAIERMSASRDIILRAAKRGELIYGVTTGLGAFKDKFIPANKIKDVQVRFLLSHAAGIENWTGACLPEENTRAMMLLAANKFATGYCGNNPAYADMLVEMLNKGLYPRIPLHGSLGSSGDLVPMAHLGLLLIGHEASKAIEENNGSSRTVSGAAALEKAGIAPVTASYKDALSIMNSTNFMTSLASLGCFDAGTLVESANTVSAMTLEALMCNLLHLDSFIFRTRNDKYQARVADNLRQMLRGSGLMKKKFDDQDAYSLRLIASHHGAATKCVEDQAAAIEEELNACTDNPIVDLEQRRTVKSEGSPNSTSRRKGRIILCGNFDGTKLAFASDALIEAIGKIAQASGVRVNRLLDDKLSRGLSPFLVFKEPGLNSGGMIPHYSGSAAALRIAQMPRAGLLSVTTSAAQEDIVSNGGNAALNLAEAASLGFGALSVEAVCAAQALDLRRAVNSHTGTYQALKAIRQYVPFLEKDSHAVYELMDTAAALLKSGELKTSEILPKIRR